MKRVRKTTAAVKVKPLDQAAALLEVLSVEELKLVLSRLQPTVLEQVFGLQLEMTVVARDYETAEVEITATLKLNNITLKAINRFETY